MVEALAVLLAGLEQPVGALDVGAEERLGVGDGVVVVRLGRVVHDRVVGGHDALEQLGVAYVAHHELGRGPLDVGGVARVGQLVEDRDLDLGVVLAHVVHEVGPDEAAAAGDDDALGLEGF